MELKECRDAKDFSAISCGVYKGIERCLKSKNIKNGQR